MPKFISYLDKEITMIAQLSFQINKSKGDKPRPLGKSSFQSSSEKKLPREDGTMQDILLK